MTTPPDDNPLLNEVSANDGIAGASITTITDAGGVVMLAPRGECSFQREAIQTQTLGAIAIIAYVTLLRLQRYIRYDQLVCRVPPLQLPIGIGLLHFSGGVCGEIGF